MVNKQYGGSMRGDCPLAGVNLAYTQQNCTKLTKLCTKLNLFCVRFAIIFWGGGTVPAPHKITSLVGRGHPTHSAPMMLGPLDCCEETRRRSPIQVLTQQCTAGS